MATTTFREKILNEMYNESEVLYKKIKDSSSFSLDDCTPLALTILGKRELIEDLYKDEKNGLFGKFYTCHEFKLLGATRKYLAKAQSQLLKKTPDLLSKEGSAVHQTISAAWKRVTGTEPLTPQFGERCLTLNRKSPITLVGICEHLRSRSDSKQSIGPVLSKKEGGITPQTLLTLTFDEYKIYDFCTNSTNFMTWFGMQFSFNYEIDDHCSQDWQRLFLTNFHSSQIQNAIEEYFLDKIATLEKAVEDQDWISSKMIVLFTMRVLSGHLDLAYIKKCTCENDKDSIIKSLAQLKNKFQDSIKQRNSNPVQPLNLNCTSPVVGILKVLPTQDKPDPELLSTLALAEEGIAFAVQKVPFSSNFYYRENTALLHDLSQQEFLDVHANLYSLRKTVVLSDLTAKNKKENVQTDEFLHSICSDKINDFYPLGNCGELTRTAFAYFCKQKIFAGKIEIFELKAHKKNEIADHIFIVLNRPKNSDPKDFRTWGSAVICDPWARISYPASFMDKIMNNYLKQVANGVPYLEKFDPKKHYCEVLAENIGSKESLDMSPMFECEEIFEPLESFINEKDISVKEKLALTMLDLLNKSDPNAKNSDNRTLKAQLEYFLYSKIIKTKNM